MTTGKINVSVDNIFPLIKKFLYSDHEIFLRELISNATDATLKLKHLASIGEAQVEIGNPVIEVRIDKEGKKIHITDQGIGMTEEEVQKYINEVAFSGAEEFLDKYKDAGKEAGIIGHFGLGFYSAFMVAKKVEIITKSFKEEAPAVQWSCDGNPEFSLKPSKKKDRGTEIILHIAEDSEEFLEDARITQLLEKYNKFMPVPIKFGTRTETLPKPEGAKEEDPAPTQEVDNIINNPTPAWTRKPTDLEDEDYKKFYRELYPMQFEEPLFHIHLNVDYPFNLTGILYFPKLNNEMNLQKDRIQSYLQADGAVKKISSYITRKVADKLQSLFKEDRESFEKKWNDIKIVIEYGLLTDDKFFEKAEAFALYPTVDGSYYTFEELSEKLKPNQTDKDDKLVILYASDTEAQHSYIEAAKAKGYEVLLMNSPIVAHLMQKLETSKEKITFARVDADHLDKLIAKEETQISKLSDDEKETLKTQIEGVLGDKSSFMVQLEPMDSEAAPFVITEPEFMRRMKEMQQTGGGMFGMGNMPDMYNLVVNTNHPLVGEILQSKTDKKRQRLIEQSLDLARLSKGLLKGEALTRFIQRSFDMVK